MTCKVCGCTDEHACYDELLDVTCGWEAPNLCSFCAEKLVEANPYPNLARAGFQIP